MNINFKQLATQTLTGLGVIATIVITAYAEGMGSRSNVTVKKALPFCSSPDDMAISELLKAAKDSWGDSAKLDIAQKICNIATKEGQTSYTKTVAIQALSQIRDEIWSSSNKSSITDLIVSLI